MNSSDDLVEIFFQTVKWFDLMKTTIDYLNIDIRKYCKIKIKLRKLLNGAQTFVLYNEHIWGHNLVLPIIFFLNI